MAASTILLVDADPPSRDVIVKALTDVGYSITTVADEVQAFAEAGDHDLVILDILSGPKSAADVCREIRATPAMVAIPVLCISQTDDVDERIRFLQAGADDVMAKPYDALELQARVEALLLRFRRSRDLAPVLAPKEIVVRRPHMVAVFSPKGGVGATTIAVNTAVSRHKRSFGLKSTTRSFQSSYFPAGTRSGVHSGLKKVRRALSAAARKIGSPSRP